MQKRTLYACGWLLAGWLLHYVPFWSMARVLYYHHYFTALLFANMISAAILDYLLQSLPTLLGDRFASHSYYTLTAALSTTLAYRYYNVPMIIMSKTLLFLLKCYFFYPDTVSIYFLRWRTDLNFRPKMPTLLCMACVGFPRGSFRRRLKKNW